MENPYGKYKSNAVFTASKEELTLMLYEGALKFCNQAIMALEQKDLIKTHEYITRVEDIIEEFQASLIRKYPIAKDFDMMYDYIYRRLIEANTTKDIEILKEIRDLLREFRDTWKDAMKIAKKTTV